MEEKKKIGLADIKTRIKDGFSRFVTFFKEFKWDKAHLTVLGKYLFEVLFFAFIITFDLCMKVYLYDFVQVQHGGNYTVIEGFFDLTYSENTGMGFGFGKSSTLGITIITAIVIVAILGYLVFFKKEKAYIRVPLIMVAAGGIGNLVDRVQLGYVRDFFEFTFMDFAIFNIADTFVTVGAIVLIIALVVMLFKPSRPAEAEGAATDSEPGVTHSEEENKTAFTVTDADGNAVTKHDDAPHNDDSTEEDAAKDAASSVGDMQEKSQETSQAIVRARFTVAPSENKKVAESASDASSEEGDAHGEDDEIRG